MDQSQASMSKKEAVHVVNMTMTWQKYGTVQEIMRPLQIRSVDAPKDDVQTAAIAHIANETVICKCP